MPSHKEEIVALLVHATGASLQDNALIDDDVISQLNDIYGEGDRSRPVLHGQLQMTFSPTNLSTEQQVRTHGKGAVARLLYWPKLLVQNLIGLALMTTESTTSSTQ